MAKKILAFVFAAILLLSVSAIPATAAPFEGGAKISGAKPGDVSVVFAVKFDTEDYNETTPQRALDGNWSWYFNSRDSGGNYAHRPEFQENENGPQTEAADVGDYGEIGAICYTHEDEWVQYTLTVETAGKYDLKVWAGTDVADKSIKISIGGKEIGIPDIIKEGWGTYNLHDVGPVELAKGTSILKLEWPGGDVNVAAFEFVLAEAAAVPEDTTAAPTNAGDTTKDGATDEKTPADANLLLWIGIAAAVVVVIVIIVVIVTKKKK